MTSPNLSAAAFAFAILCATVPAQQDEFTWHTDLDAARALAAEQHKPLFVLFRCER